jgi:hypothetical protein
MGERRDPAQRPSRCEWRYAEYYSVAPKEICGPSTKPSKRQTRKNAIQRHSNTKTGACCTAKDFREAIAACENEKKGKTMAATERREATAGIKIAKEVERGVAKALMDKSPAVARAKKNPNKAASSPLNLKPPGAPTKKRKRRCEWDDEHVATEPEDGIPINPPIDDEEDDRPPPPLQSMIEVDVS